MRKKEEKKLCHPLQEFSNKTVYIGAWSQKWRKRKDEVQWEQYNKCIVKFKYPDLDLGVACLGSIFFPSNMWTGTASTLWTVAGSPKVMNPNPRLLCKNKRQKSTALVS